MTRIFALISGESMSVEATNPSPFAKASGEEVEEEVEDLGGRVEPEETAEAEPVEETEEVEHDGKKYRIPKPLKGALLMQADYTRKTQEVAAERRQLEERSKALNSEQQAHGEHLSEIARVVGLNDAIAQFEKADWPQIRANNPAAYDQLWFQYQQTRDARDKAVTLLQTKVQERNSQAQQETARRFEEARSAIAREIPEWSPELAGKLNSFAMAQGFTAEELRQVSDPRLVKLIHTAFKASQIQQTNAATIKAKAAEAAKPLPTVSGSGSEKIRPSDPASDRLSTEEWARRRNQQFQKQRTRR
jgi:hypothetical protein